LILLSFLPVDITKWTFCQMTSGGFDNKKYQQNQIVIKEISDPPLAAQLIAGSVLLHHYAPHANQDLLIVGGAEKLKKYRCADPPPTRLRSAPKQVP
jgi:hypothetical protein